MNKKHRGFSLYVALIFMSVMLSIGLTLGSLGFKQQILASNTVSSQNAFYAANTALECALYADQQLGSFAYPATDPGVAPSISCSGGLAISAVEVSYSGTRWVVSERFSLGATRCADVLVSKLATGGTQIFAQGYDASCATVQTPNGARFTVRGLKSSY